MPNYFDVLPKELRNELMYFRCHPLGVAFNKYLEKYMNYAKSQGGIEEFNKAISEIKSKTIPLHINAIIIIQNNYSTHIKILSTHLITPAILTIIINNMFAVYYTSFKEEKIAELNAILHQHGFTEQLLMYPHANGTKIILMDDMGKIDKK